MAPKEVFSRVQQTLSFVIFISRSCQPRKISTTVIKVDARRYCPLAKSFHSAERSTIFVTLSPFKFLPSSLMLVLFLSFIFLSFVSFTCFLRSSTHPENRRGRKINGAQNRRCTTSDSKNMTSDLLHEFADACRFTVDRKLDRIPFLDEGLYTSRNGVNSRARIPDVENHPGVSATCDPSPTRGRHAPQRDATRCNAGQGLVGGRPLVGPGNGARGDPGVPSVTEPEQASRSRAHRLAQPANSYLRQKCSPSRETLPRMYLSRQVLP